MSTNGTKNKEREKVDLSIWGFIAWSNWFLLIIVGGIAQSFKTNNIELINYPSSHYLEGIVLFYMIFILTPLTFWRVFVFGIKDL